MIVILHLTGNQWEDIKQALAELDDLYHVDLRKANDIQQNENEDQIADLECALAASWNDIQVIGTISRSR